MARPRSKSTPPTAQSPTVPANRPPSGVVIALRIDPRIATRVAALAKSTKSTRAKIYAQAIETGLKSTGELK
jgi:hypothetical protein